jgi:hypothetical protein
LRNFSSFLPLGALSLLENTGFSAAVVAKAPVKIKQTLSCTHPAVFDIFVHAAEIFMPLSWIVVAVSFQHALTIIVFKFLGSLHP